MRAFSRVRLHPLKEARDLLTSLKQTGAFNLYIVSEGYPDTQWNKLCSIGLSKFFGQSHVLTTGDVAPNTTTRGGSLRKKARTSQTS